MRQHFAVVIGDANGSDKVMQSYFASKSYRNVTVYCMADHCRNNLGDWPTKHVSASRQKKDFAYYATKDEEMARSASYGFMIWDGKSKGTLNNILNLLKQQKKVLVYFSPDKSCHTLESAEDLASLLGRCSSIDRRKFEKEFTLSTFAVAEEPGIDLFPACWSVRASARSSASVFRGSGWYWLGYFRTYEG